MRSLPYFGANSNVTRLSIAGTGLTSLENASAPTRSASSGIAPPPQNGSSTRGRLGRSGDSHCCADVVRPEATSMNSGTVDASQFEKSPMKASSRSRSRPHAAASRARNEFSSTTRHSGQWSEVNSASSFVVLTFSAKAQMSRAASIRNPSGQRGSAGSGHSAAHATARQAASGRRAHQICSVEILPWRIDFSLRACSEMRRIGRSTSMSRFG